MLNKLPEDLQWMIWRSYLQNVVIQEFNYYYNVYDDY